MDVDGGVGAAGVAFDGSQRARDDVVVLRLHLRPALRVAGGMRSTVRDVPGAGVPRVEHGVAPLRFRGPSGEPVVDPGGVASVL